MRRAGVVALLSVCASFVALFAIAADAQSKSLRRQRDQHVIHSVARLLPSGDLAWSGGARWVRFVSLEEPTAASADGPLMPDPDPAGVLASPPRNLGAVQR